MVILFNKELQVSPEAIAGMTLFMGNFCFLPEFIVALQ